MKYVATVEVEFTADPRIAQAQLHEIAERMITPGRSVSLILGALADHYHVVGQPKELES